MKHIYLLITLFLFLSLSISSAYLFIPNKFQSLDNRIRDFYFLIRGPEKADNNIVIIDIDEKSIKALGQWPWERNKIAQILQNLTYKNTGIIGLDIVFAEKDKTSPIHFIKKLHLKNIQAADYDKELAQTISSTPTILGYQFDFQYTNNHNPPSIPAIFIEKNRQKQEFLPVAKGVLTNLNILQNAAYSSGYINNIPDEAGMIRSVPLIIKYQNQLFTSLALEMYRIAINAKKVIVKYSQAGVESVTLQKENIPVDRFAKLYINFRGPSKSYKYLSAIDIFNNKFDKQEIEGKFILIGTSAYGLMDLRATPMDNVLAGVEVHANIIDNLLHHDMLQRPVYEEIINIMMIIFIIFLIVLIYSQFRFFIFIFLSLLTTYGIFYFIYYILFIHYTILNSIFPLLSIIFSLISTLAIKYLFEYRQKVMIKNSFSKKVSKQVMEDLLKNPDSSHLSAKELEVTIYFSDIRNFTTISEQLHSPKKITKFLNYYMTNMVKIIEKNSGTIDKFIGDAVMSYWNAPIHVTNHADKAVTTALEQINLRDTLNKSIHKEFGFNVDYGIGINTGLAVVGEIGSKGRSDYTIIGDSVNLASRLEGLCKAYKVRLIVSEFTKEKLTSEYVMQLLDIVKVKGKSEPIKIYEVIKKGNASSKQKKELKEYEIAHNYYIKGSFKNALSHFQKLHQKHPKFLYQLYIQRCQQLQKTNPQKFDGVFEFTTK